MSPTRTATKAKPSPVAFLKTIPEPQRAELLKLHALIRKTVPELAPSVVSGGIGYGPYHYTYATGREGDSFIVALAPRKGSISLYVTGYVDGKYLAESYASRLGKANCGKSCVRFRRVDELNEAALKSLLRAASRASKSSLAAGRIDAAHARSKAASA
ncbi:MAG: DUF1801 domain-containing protein [Chloroflexota bacterium]|nr:DUF1801 domain-containing protein [Chloroflexota bacterium]